MKKIILAVSLIAFFGIVQANDFSDVVPEALVYNHADDNALAEAYWKDHSPTAQPTIRNFKTDIVYMHTDVIPEAMLEPF